MECLQYLARQGIARRGNEDGNDNFTQLLLLRGKDQPIILDRSKSSFSERRYTHHDYQNELLSIMVNNVLRAKLNDIKVNKVYAIMCDEYTDVSNKKQFKRTWRFFGVLRDTKYKKRYNCYGYKRCSYSNEYNGASYMLGHKSGVAKQISDVQPKAPTAMAIH